MRSVLCMVWDLPKYSLISSTGYTQSLGMGLCSVFCDEYCFSGEGDCDQNY